MHENGSGFLPVPLPAIRFLVLLFSCFVFVNGQFQWQIRDSIDEISRKLEKVDQETCQIVDRNELFLPSSTVTHIPDFKSLGIDPIFPNRTNLLHIHNMALSRAFYYRYTQSLNFTTIV